MRSAPAPACGSARGPARSGRRSALAPAGNGVTASACGARPRPAPGDTLPLVNAHSIHELRHDAYNAVWDNSIDPALEVASGEVVELHARDASDGQLDRSSQAQDVPQIDFDRVNPVSGPVFVKGARPGDTLAVELLEFRPRDWGWTAIIPGFGLLAEEFPDPWFRISSVDFQQGVVRFGERVTLPLRPFSGNLGGCDA